MFKWIERRDYRGSVPKEPAPESLDEITAAKKEAAEIMSGCQGADAPAYVQAKAIWDLLNDQFQIVLAKEAGLMARRAAQPPQPPDIRQFRTAGDIDTAIAKLRRRVADIERLRTDNIRHDDDRVDNVEHSVRDTILEAFGKDSPEFQLHAYFKIDDGPRYVRSDFMGGGNDDAEDQQRLVVAIEVPARTQSTATGREDRRGQQGRGLPVGKRQAKALARVLDTNRTPSKYPSAPPFCSIEPGADRTLPTLCFDEIELLVTTTDPDDAVGSDYQELDLVESARAGPRA